MCRILVVDNTPDFRSTLVRLLTDVGHTVQEAASDGDAWAAIEQESFDFALIDVRLHEESEDDESGLSLAAAFRAHKPDMHVIMLTGYVRARQIVRAIQQYGVADFVEKTPDVGEQVLRIVDQILEARRKTERPVQYNIGAIRQLTRDAFTDKELRRFCQDDAVFRPILTSFGADFSLEDMTDVLIEYCRTRLLFLELLSGIRKWNPKQYKRHEKQLYTSAVLS